MSGSLLLAPLSNLATTKTRGKYLKYNKELYETILFLHRKRHKGPSEIGALLCNRSRQSIFSIIQRYKHDPAPLLQIASRGRQAKFTP